MRLNVRTIALPAMLWGLLTTVGAEAQVPDQILREMLGTLPTLQRNGQSPNFDPSNSAPFGNAPRSNISASKPTISCVNVQSPLAMFLCSDPNAAKADWDVSAAAWAYSGSLIDVAARTDFQKDQDGWVQSIIKSCRLDSSLSEPQRRCVIDSYRARTTTLLARLSSNAADEARLPPEQRAELQARLVLLGFMRDQPDGEFGPNTRAAIKAFQQTQHTPETGFLTREERQQLLTPGQTVATQMPGSSGPERMSPAIAQANPLQPAPRFPTQISNEAGVSLAQPGVPQAGTKTVEVTGVGETAETAQKDAARLAVQQVAGVYIDDRRRVETKMSADQVSQIVEEKLLSYTNAYVSKLEPVSEDCKDGNCRFAAKVTVNVGPLLKTLRASAVPTVEFDSNSAEAAATTLGTERANAFATYKDLVSRLDELITIGVGNAEVNPNLPSASDSVWLSIPITFFANPSATKEWAEKFRLIAVKREQVSLQGGWMRTRTGCELQGVGITNSPLFQRGNSDASRAIACFISATTPRPGNESEPNFNATADCFVRTFVREEAARVSLKKTILLIIEFIDKGGNVMQSLAIEMSKFPELPAPELSSGGQDRPFLDYCTAVGRENRLVTGLFYRSFPNYLGGGDDVIIFPPGGSRTNALLNVRIGSDKVGQIARIRASLKDKSQPTIGATK